MNTQTIIEQIKQHAIRLESTRDLGALIEQAGEARYVLLGEASHGTSEFYTWRTEISKRLIEEKGFSFIAVEGDWPSCYEVNRYIKQYGETASPLRNVMETFRRWPTWMWANQEVMTLANWLKKHNASLPDDQKAGFYGLDVYSLWESMEEILAYLKKTNAPELEIARRAFSCFEPFQRDAQTYGASAAFLSEGCENEVLDLLSALQNKRKTYENDSESTLSAEINALVTANAEKYYRSMVRGGPDSWNIRDHHMVETLNRLLAFHGPEAKAIIWEHNTHIGDARATDMPDEGLVNVGQLVREQHGEEHVFAVGFGTHRGTVIAAKQWGDPLQIMTVPPAQAGSWEDLIHRAGTEDKLLLLRDSHPCFRETAGHRAIGVVYQPQYERFGNYVPTSLSHRYDAFIYLDETRALHPLTLSEVLV